MKKLVSFFKTLEGQKLIIVLIILWDLYTICTTSSPGIKYITAFLLMILIGLYGMINEVIGIKKGAEIMTQEVIKLFDAKIEQIKKHIRETIIKNN